MSPCNSYRTEITRWIGGWLVVGCWLVVGLAVTCHAMYLDIS